MAVEGGWLRASSWWAPESYDTTLPKGRPASANGLLARALGLLEPLNATIEHAVGGADQRLGLGGRPLDLFIEGCRSDLELFVDHSDDFLDMLELVVVRFAGDLDLAAQPVCGFEKFAAQPFDTPVKPVCGLAEFAAQPVCGFEKFAAQPVRGFEKFA